LSEPCVIRLLYFRYSSVGCRPVSNLRSLQMPERCRAVPLPTARGEFAILEAKPTRGVSDRRPALLIPGYTGSKENFLPILEPLAAAGRTVVAVDLRGQYQTPHAADWTGYKPDSLAADVLAIASAVGDGAGVHLVGHSLGGLIARETVLWHAAGFLSLTLLGSGPGRIDGQRAAELRDLLAQAETAHGEWRPSDKARLAAVIRRSWIERQEPQARAEGTGEHVIAFLRERALQTCPLSLMVLAQYLLTCPDRTDELAVVTAELATLVVYGENDDAWPPAVQDVMARRLGAQRACIPGAAHSPAIEAPVTTASTLTEFWNAAERRLPTVHHCGRAHHATATAG
jgi:pimeloyl-ACP methyl ester carboxylesterase